MLQTVVISPQTLPQASVIWMHGLGANGYDFVDVVEQMPCAKELSIRFIFPHAPVRTVQYADNAKMRAWFDVISLEHGAKEDAVGIKTSATMIAELITQELTLHIPSEKIVLAGFSQGGAMALQCGLRYPKKLAGILVLSSWLPLASSVLAEKNTANQQTPILMLHGTSDTLIPLSWAAESYHYLRKIGYQATLSSYPMQHTVCPEEIATINTWLYNLLS